MKIDWTWIGWQVAAPLIGPPIAGLLIYALWRVVGNETPVDWSVLADLTPWAILTYAFVLAGTTLRLREPKGYLFWGTLTLSIIELVLYAFILVRRLSKSPVSGEAMVLAAILVVCTIVLCYLQRQVLRGSSR